MENYERVESELLEQCGQIALMECFAWLQRCDECIEQLEELCCPSVRALPLNIDNPRWPGSCGSRVQSCNWSDGSYMLVASTRVASTRVATNDLLSGERSMVVINIGGLHRAAAVFRRPWQCSARASERCCRKTIV